MSTIDNYFATLSDYIALGGPNSPLAAPLWVSLDLLWAEMSSAEREVCYSRYSQWLVENPDKAVD